jgi:VanZ family protein
MKWHIIILVLWTLALLGVLLAPIGEAEIPAPWGFKHWDKVYHFGLFAVTGFVAVFSDRFLSLFRSRMLFGIVFGLFLAVSTEFAQSLIPVRNMSLYDLLADIVGLGSALSLYAFLYHHAGLRAFFKL